MIRSLPSLRKVSCLYESGPRTQTNPPYYLSHSRGQTKYRAPYNINHTSSSMSYQKHLLDHTLPNPKHSLIPPPPPPPSPTSTRNFTVSKTAPQPSKTTLTSEHPAIHRWYVSLFVLDILDICVLGALSLLTLSIVVELPSSTLRFSLSASIVLKFKHPRHVDGGVSPKFSFVENLSIYSVGSWLVFTLPLG